MTTGYVALYTIGGDGLGIASAATDVSLANRNLALGTGSLTATNVTGTLQTASQPNITTLAGCSRIAGSVANFSFGGVGSAGRSVTLEMALAVASGVGSVEGLYVGGSLGSSSGTLTSATQLQVSPLFTGNVGTITSAYGLYILGGGSTGTITTGYGLRVATPLFGTSRVCALFDGVVGVGGVPNLGSALNVTGTWTTAVSNTISGVSVRPTFALTAYADWARSVDASSTFIAPSATFLMAAAGLYIYNTASSNVGTIAGLFGIYIDNGSTATGTVSDAYGLYCRAPAHGSNKYTAYFESGVGIGVAHTAAGNFALRSTTIHVGDALDGTAYGLLQITRPAVNGTTFYQSFVRSSNKVAGLGFLSSSNTFAIQSTNDNTGSAGIFIDEVGLVGVGVRAPDRRLSVQTPNTTTNEKILYLKQSNDFGFSWNLDTQSTGDMYLRGVNNGVEATIVTFSRATNLVTLSTGLRLPTSGGTVTTLDYYEELTATITFSGIWASSQAVSARFVRVGKQVTILVPAAQTTANTAAVITGTAIASQFRPAVTSLSFISIKNNGATNAGALNFSTTGVMTIYPTVSGGTFTASGIGGFDGFSLSYNVLA